MNIKIFRRLACLLCLFLPCVVNAAFLPLSKTVDKVNIVNENIQSNEEDQKTADPKTTVSIEEDYKAPPFLDLIKQGKLKEAKELKEKDDQVINAKDEFGNNALHVACISSGSVAMVTWLLDVCKIGLESKGEYQKTPFICAAQKGELDIAKLLRQRDANIKVKDKCGNNALHWACAYSNSVAMVTWLLDVCNIGLETKGCIERTPFLCAAEKGHFDIAKLLKGKGANIQALDEYRNNALHFACAYSNSVAMVTWLLDQCGMDKEERGEYKNTAFLCAVEKGQLAIAKLLKGKGANIQALDKCGNNALHLACAYSDNVDMVTWLLDVCNMGLETKGCTKRTPFLSAVRKGQLNIAKLLKERGANINAKDKWGNNALHLACAFSGSVAMVTWLLDECKISIETKGFAERPPFLSAVRKGQLAIAKLLRQRGAKINAVGKWDNNALHFACAFSDSVDMVTWLLDVCKIGLESKGEYQKTPFLYAAQKGKLPIAKLLRQRGANINAADKDGDNALHFACAFSGSVDMVTWLLDVCKISIESKGLKQRTPFILAGGEGQLAIAELLKKRGADTNVKGEEGNNALHWACLRSGSVAMVKWLLDQCGMDKEERGKYQNTPFLYAAEGGHLATAKILKKRDANINAVNEYGDNALDLAKSNYQKQEIINWLSDVCELQETTWLNGVLTWIGETSVWFISFIY